MRYATWLGLAIVLIGMALAACGGPPVTPSEAIGGLVTPAPLMTALAVLLVERSDPAPAATD